MSKLFNDPTYTSMAESEEGWLELAIEPFHFELNEKIAQLPQEVELDYDYFKRYMQNDYTGSRWGNNISLTSIVNAIATASLGKQLNHSELYHAVKLFDLHIKDDTVLDLENETLSNPIRVVKKQDRFSEEEVPEIVADMAIRHIDIRETRGHEQSGIISRMNEIMDLIGATNYRSSRSIRRKHSDIRHTFGKIIKEDTWRIRSADILIDAAKNITSYCNNGNRHALMNLTRLKCMTHKGNPIYSMEEIS